MAVEHPQDPRQEHQDLDLVAMMNEARTPERLNELMLIARARRRGRRGLREHGRIDVSRRTPLRLLLPRRA